MATSAHTEVPGQKAPFPPFHKEKFASQLVWFVIAFVALYLIISKLAIPRIGGIIAARGNQIANDFAEAEKFRKQSDAALTAYEKALADARNRAQTLAAETRERLNAQAEETRKRLDAELAEKLAAAEKTIAATKTAAMANVHSIAVEFTAAIVERLIGTAPPATAVETAVADVLKR